jgi:hypothetical protein
MSRGIVILLFFLIVLAYGYLSKSSEPAESSPPPKAPSIPGAQQPTVGQKTQPGSLTPVSAGEVKKLALILDLNELKDGSIIEFHISESRGESFTVTVNRGAISIRSGEAASKDLVIWVSRKAFYEILSSSNPTETIKGKVGTGEMSFTREASMITLYRKGYKKLVNTLGLL